MNARELKVIRSNGDMPEVERDYDGPTCGDAAPFAITDRVNDLADRLERVSVQLHNIKAVMHGADPDQGDKEGPHDSSLLSRLSHCNDVLAEIECVSASINRLLTGNDKD